MLPLTDLQLFYPKFDGVPLALNRWNYVTEERLLLMLEHFMQPNLYGQRTSTFHQTDRRTDGRTSYAGITRPCNSVARVMKYLYNFFCIYARLAWGSRHSVLEIFVFKLNAFLRWGRQNSVKNDAIVAQILPLQYMFATSDVFGETFERSILGSISQADVG